jgi:hypothetical protein
MRVPSIGLTRDERRIVEEGYRLAEHMLRNYQDPPSLVATVRGWLTNLRLKVSARH